MLEHFHFLQPLWFLALIPMTLVLWWLPRARQADSQWQRACESHLLPYLLNKPVQAFAQAPLWLLAAGWLVAVVALADPVWQKQPQPVFRNQHAAVVVLDLSRSMLSSDLTPSRLERARYKVAEILKQRKDGQTGLVVFAGAAFTVSPLTNDARTIQALLTPLNPDLMPVQGSRADLGIQQAGELLKQAGAPHGDILLISDGYSDPRALDVAADLHRQGYRLSVLGVGSNQPAPIPAKQGGFVRDSQGKVVMPELDVTRMQELASQGGGHYATITVNDSDLARVLPSSQQVMDTPMQATEQLTDRWQSQGPWLILILLPLAALAFRRGWLLSVPLALMLTLGGTPQPAMASGWDDLWQRQDQQADKALKNGDVERARQLAEQPLRRGEAAYRAGDYASALKDFSASDNAQGHYNRGNALAQLGRYQEAIKAYDQALTEQPEMADAIHNKQELEKLLKQQKQQQSENKDGKNKDDKQQQAENKDGQGKDNQQQQAENKDDQGKDNQQQQAENDKSAGKENLAQQADDKNTEDASIDQQQADAQTQAQQRAASATAAQDTASQEQQLADERWLRRIPDDPGGLLRRKFLYQYSQRGGQAPAAQQDW